MNRATRIIATVFVLVATWAAAQDGPRAYRDINFGDSQEVVIDKVLADEAFTSDDRIPFARRAPTTSLRLEALYDPWIHIGYNAYKVYFYFHEDQLFMIEFEAKAVPANEYETWTLDHWSTLVNVIEEARGEADLVRSPRFSDLTPGSYIWTHQWHENEAGVEHRVGLHAFAGAPLFTALLWVEWAPLRDIVYAERERERDAETKDAANDF